MEYIISEQKLKELIKDAWDKSLDFYKGNTDEWVDDFFESEKKQLILSGVSKRYFLFGCINADKQKLKKLIIAPDRENAIADIETNYPYIEKWYSSEELNVC